MYICAPHGFIESTQQILSSLGLPKAPFHPEDFSPPTSAFESDGKTHTIEFSRSGLSIEVDGDVTLMEAAHQAGIPLASGCQRGLCRACVCTKREGYTQLDEHKPQPDVRITMCNSLPRSERVVIEL